MTPPQTKVLSIVGPGRSGTTILASILGEVPEIFSAGEIRWLWGRGHLGERPCGCGLSTAQCPVWSVVLDRVLAAAVPGPDEPAARAEVVRAITADQRELSSRRRRLQVIRCASGHARPWPALRRMQTITEDVSAAAVEVTGARLLVDTSKRAQEAAMMAAAPGIDHYVLHIVRDPRAVAYSWRRTKQVRPDGDGSTMGRRRLASSVTRWLENCLGAELLRRQLPADRWMSVRYEDFAADPRDTVDRLLAFVGLDVPSPFQDASTVVLGPNHIAAGNPSRFRRGPVEIVLDSEWRSRMSLRDQRVVVAMTAPFLRRYGYSARVGRLRRAS